MDDELVEVVSDTADRADDGTAPRQAASRPRFVERTWGQSRTFTMSRPGVTPALVAVIVSGCLFVVLGFSVAWAPLALAGFIAAFTAMFLMVAFGMSGGVSLRAARDGLFIRRTFGRDLFVPYAALETVEADEARITLRWRSGKVRHLQLLASGGEGVVLVDPRESLLVRAITDGIRLSRAKRRPEEALLSRGARTVPEWVDALERMAKDGSSYRSAVVPRATLLEIAIDPDAEPSARIGAAFVLRRLGLRREERRALIAADDHTANPRVRAGLRAATKDHADLVAVLERSTSAAAASRE